MDGPDREFIVLPPLHQKAGPALDGHGPLAQIVDRLHRETVQLIAEKVLNGLREMLVLLPPRRDLGLGDGGGDLTFDVFKHDVSDVAGALRPSVPPVVPGHQRAQRPVSGIQPLPFVHLPLLPGEGRAALREPSLPQFQFLSIHPVLPLSRYRGVPHRASNSRRMAASAFA